MTDLQAIEAGIVELKKNKHLPAVLSAIQILEEAAIRTKTQAVDCHTTGKDRLEDELSQAKSRIAELEKIAASMQPLKWIELLRKNKTATDEVIGAFLRGHAEYLTGETFVSAIGKCSHN